MRETGRERERRGPARERELRGSSGAVRFRLIPQVIIREGA